MLLGRALGTAVCSIKSSGLEDVKLLVVQPLDRHLKPLGGLQVAVDVIEAGSGDLCVMVRSREAALAMRGEKFVPVDLALVGIVDELDLRPDGDFDFTLKTGLNSYT
jgi:ethanolamine utilization protein EutN